MPGEDGLLLDGLDRNEAHGGLARGDGDGQRIVAVVLAALAEGDDELGGHQPRGVAAGGEAASPVMRRAAGFHRHNAATGQRLGPALEGGPAQHLALDHSAARIEQADGKHILGEIDADGSNLSHDFPSRSRLMTRHLNRGTSMPCDSRVASGRGSPSYSFQRTAFGSR
jgi:hypothetical protein